MISALAILIGAISILIAFIGFLGAMICGEEKANESKAEAYGTASLVLAMCGLLLAFIAGVMLP